MADAAFLGGGGRLLLRLDGREPVELYGYQVSAEHLERLVRVMRSAYPTTQPAPVQPTTPPPPPAPTALPETDDTADVPVPPPLRPEPETPTFQPDASTQVDVRRPPVEVTCFGGPRVLCAGFQVWPSTVSGDAKPWELLLYLACQPAEGVAKAEAVEALWPEDEEPEDAPHRFRQLRYRLRRLLLAAPRAPDSEGICLDRGTLRLDPHIVASDAQAFLAHVRRAKVTSGPEAVEHLEQARALYTGDLMEGPDARRYAWVVERDDSGVTLREHFRRLFQQATCRLAELNAASGALEASVDLYRELSDIDPADERVWLSLFRLHAERGDRLALLREEHRMRETLRELTEEFGPTDAAEDGELSRETAREFQRLLASMRDREPATA
jgi:DNA-binding SARP family transcriptional activator